MSERVETDPKTVRRDLDLLLSLLAHELVAALKKESKEKPEFAQLSREFHKKENTPRKGR